MDSADVWNGIICQLAIVGDVRDLLRISRVSKLHRGVVLQSEAAWMRAYEAAFGSSEPLLEPGCSGSWREHFKHRFLQNQRQERLLNSARRLRATSMGQLLRQEVFRTEQALARERCTLSALTNQLAALRGRQQAEAAHEVAQLFWQPRAVTSALGRHVVMQDPPENWESRVSTLEQELKVSRLEVRKLQAALHAQQQRLEAAEALVRALEP